MMSSWVLGVVGLMEAWKQGDLGLEKNKDR